jgi:hypothetical protein
MMGLGVAYKMHTKQNFLSGNRTQKGESDKSLVKFPLTNSF